MTLGTILIIVAPVFTIIFLGIGLGRTPLFASTNKDGSASNDQISNALIRYVNYIAIPALLVRALAPRELPQSSELIMVLGYYSAMYLVYFLVLKLIAPALSQKKDEAAISALIACFANIGFVGLPIAEGAYGNEGIRLFLMIMSFHSLTLVPTTYTLIAKARQDGSKASAFNLGAMIKSNPVLISLATGLSWSFLGLPYPDWLDRILTLPAQSAAPVGLFAGGLALSRLSLAGDVRQILSLSAVKLLLMPLAVWLVTRHIMDLADSYVFIAVLLAGLPAGLIPYMIANDQKIAPRRAASSMLVTALLAPFTLTFILWLSGNGLL